MNPYLPPDRQNIDDIPIEDDDCDTDRPMTEGEAEIAKGLAAYLDQAEEDCTHEEYHMGRCVACSASQIDGAYPKREPIFKKYPVRDLAHIEFLGRVVFNPPVTIHADDDVIIHSNINLEDPRKSTGLVITSRDTSKMKVPSKNGIMSIGSVTQKFAIGCIFALLLVAILYVANKGLRRQELVACQQLATYSQRYTDFYLTKSEKQMCDSYGITIYAPVK